MSMRNSLAVVAPLALAFGALLLLRLTGRDSASPSPRPISRCGTLASARTVPDCLRAAARPPRAPSVFAEKCELCHGKEGKGGPSAALRRTGAQHRQLTCPMQRRSSTSRGGRCHGHGRSRSPMTKSMPVTAYILALNKIIADNDVMNAETLPKVQMPNRNGFVSRYPENITTWRRTAY